MADIKVDVYSDIACPWCYVGKRKFGIALEKMHNTNPNIKIETNWHPYMIDPGTNINGEKYMDYNVRRWGGDGWCYELREAGKQVGANFANWKIWPHTLLCHCLVTTVIDKTNDPKKGDEAVNALFEAVYENGENVSDPKVVARIGKELFGLEESEWNNDERKKIVRQKDTMAKREMGISGVPYFVINNKYVLHGAQSQHVFFNAFKKVAGI
ncbi:thioredoxin-like protein [Anaeromyces robustus]|uniref:Thioredoxin-like protein n=1 Tax=Anaeromyces robustus TaxID=1754192 RepID=A0A1Y1XLV8_9FUNG|nr:thioredoxin-like protein [Anaeromyces robustus]|eukprot:ORX86496.1 thioredoxin-like protein [Anaeromyces robustus]